MDRIQFRLKELMQNDSTPVITLMNNGREFNFIVDTGSSTSAVNRDALEYMDYTPLIDKQKSIGIEGNEMICDMCGIRFTDENSNIFVDVMTIVDMSSAFDYIDNENIHIHGLIGSSFLSNYRGILDFDTRTISLLKYR